MTLKTNFTVYIGRDLEDRRPYDKLQPNEADATELGKQVDLGGISCWYVLGRWSNVSQSALVYEVYRVGMLLG